MIHDHMTLRECQCAATVLDGLVQAMDAIDGDSTPQAFQGRGALLAAIGQYSDALSTSLDRLEDAATTPDPILEPYNRWWKAFEEFGRLAVLPDADWESPEMVALCDARNIGFDDVDDGQPVNMAGIAAVAHVIWANSITYRPGSPDFDIEVNEPNTRMIAAIWRCASGKTGLPPI